MFDYDTETRVEALDEHSYGGYVHPHWNIGDNPNGGYLLSIVLQALKHALPHADPLTVTSHFLRPGVASAECQVVVDVVRVGRTMSTARATLMQDNKARLEVLAGFGDLATAAGIADELTIRPPELPAVAECVPRSGAIQQLDLPITQRVAVHLHPQQAHPGQAGQAIISGWIGFTDGRVADSLSLPLFADAFPPSPLGWLGVIGWVPTVELTVHVRAQPVPGWIRAQFTTQDLQGGRMLESGLLWDSADRLVAQSRQIGLVIEKA
ncbi:MAG: thioesterase family protein [Pseudomonadota bacterium]